MKKELRLSGSDTAVFLLFLLDMEATNVYTARRTLKIISLGRGMHIQNQLVA
jgi:hypothetical protein